MWRTFSPAFFCAIALFGCADPHFIHDPQVGFFGREQIPPLLKSLRCELATYIAANNQRKIINAEKYKDNPAAANHDYPFFRIDQSRFGGITLELKIQDTLGTQSGTTADWKRTVDALHTRVWHIAPNVGEQNSYDLLTAFLLPQDIYGLDESLRTKMAAEQDELSTNSDAPFLCYSQIDQTPGRIFHQYLYNEIFTEQDLDGLAYGKTGIPQFDRIKVNASLPLAAWLLDVGSSVSSTNLISVEHQANEEIIPGQVSYTFIIQTSLGLDVKNTISTSLWTSLGVELGGGWQHTGTMTLVLNGLDAPNAAGVKTGNTGRSETIPLKPTSRSVRLYCPLPVINQINHAGYQTGPFCYWPPKPKVILNPQVAQRAPILPTPKPTKPGLVEEESISKIIPPIESPAIRAAPKFRPATNARPFLNKPHGAPDYPLPLLPPG